MRHLGMVGLLIVLAACGQHRIAGTAFEWDNAQRVTVGMTEAEVVALIGKPNSVSTAGNVQVWGWVYSYATFGAVNSRHVSFSFKDGKVSAVPNLTQFR